MLRIHAIVCKIQSMNTALSAFEKAWEAFADNPSADNHAALMRAIPEAISQSKVDSVRARLATTEAGMYRQSMWDAICMVRDDGFSVSPNPYEGEADVSPQDFTNGFMSVMLKLKNQLDDGGVSGTSDRRVNG